MECDPSRAPADARPKGTRPPYPAAAARTIHARHESKRTEVQSVEAVRSFPRRRTSPGPPSLLKQMYTAKARCSLAWAVQVRTSLTSASRIPHSSLAQPISRSFSERPPEVHAVDRLVEFPLDVARVDSLYLHAPTLARRSRFTRSTSASFSGRRRRVRLPSLVARHLSAPRAAGADQMRGAAW